MYSKYRLKSARVRNNVPVIEGDFDYDVIVIGAGPGGMSAAKEAGMLGRKVALLDFVKPSPKGSTWKLGGTCINVGCIPDKLMHYAALSGESMRLAHRYGWKGVGEQEHDWRYLIDRVQEYIAVLNHKFEEQLKKLNVVYINAYAEFVGPHTVKATDKDGKATTMTARYFLLAVGSRPKYPDDIPGVKEHCITSDDLFSLPYSPGRTITIGGSFVSLEIAGFLTSLGLDVTVMTRSILLRGFDQHMAEKVGISLINHGVKFIRPAVPLKVEQLEEGSPGKYRVTMKLGNGSEYAEEYNTVIISIGRRPATRGMGLATVGVQTDEIGYVLHSDDEQSTCPYIYAVGDILEGKPDMAPTAAQAGKLVMRRIFTGCTTRMYYQNVPIAVFAPIEYGSVGMSEEAAMSKFGEHDIEVYHTHFQPLEWALPQKAERVCYAKLICVISQDERVVGFHMTGPNAAEITQGFTIGLNLGATKADFDKTVGIHPTCAEVFTLLDITKGSGLTQHRVGAEVKPCYTEYQRRNSIQRTWCHVQDIEGEENVKTHYFD